MKKISTYLFLFFIIFSSCLHYNGNTQIQSAVLNFPKNTNIVEIPFTRYRGWIIIKVSINNSQNLSFILDTGAPIAVLANTTLGKQLHLNITGNALVSGSDSNKAKSVPLATAVSFKIGSVTIEKGMMAVGAASEVINGVDGIIGKYLFDNAVVTIDWDDNKLILTKPEVFKYTGAGTIIPITLLPSGHIYSEISVDKNGKKQLLKSDIDLGNRSNFFIDKEMGEPVGANDKTIKNIIVLWGANGAAYGDITRTDIRIGSLPLNNVITAFGQSGKLIKQDGLNANIGLSILEKFTLIFDYTHKKLILEKNKNFTSPFTFNRSGIIINPKKGSDYILIADIIPMSSAEENGLLKDDKIMSINGKNISALSFDEIDNFIQGKAANTMRLLIMRNGKEFISTLSLKEII